MHGHAWRLVIDSLFDHAESILDPLLEGSTFFDLGVCDAKKETDHASRMHSKMGVKKGPKSLLGRSIKKVDHVHGVAIHFQNVESTENLLVSQMIEEYVAKKLRNKYKGVCTAWPTHYGKGISFTKNDDGTETFVWYIFGVRVSNNFLLKEDFRKGRNSSEREEKAYRDMMISEQSDMLKSQGMMISEQSDMLESQSESLEDQRLVLEEQREEMSRQSEIIESLTENVRSLTIQNNNMSNLLTLMAHRLGVPVGEDNNDEAIHM